MKHLIDSEGHYIACHYTDAGLLPGDLFADAPPPEDRSIRHKWLDGQWVPDPVIIQPPTQEQLLAVIRQKRNSLLAASDWTQVADSPLSPEKRTAWAEYRQQLRDFPETCDVDDPAWPVAP